MGKLFPYNVMEEKQREYHDPTRKFLKSLKKGEYVKISHG
jgi:hypothetical protein